MRTTSRITTSPAPGELPPTSPVSRDDPDHDELGRLRRAVLRLTRRMRQQVHTGVTPAQLSALAVIDRRGPLPLGELAAAEEIQPPSMSRIVACLERDGYVQRTVDPADRRLALLAATPRARQELRRVRKARNDWLGAQLDQLDEADRALLIAALPVLERLSASEEPR